MGDMEPEELAVRCLVRDEGGAAVDVVEEIVEVERPAHDLGRVPAKVRVLAERRQGRGRGLELGGLRDVAALLGGAVGGGDCCGGLGLRVGRLGVHLGLVGLARGLDGL